MFKTPSVALNAIEQVRKVLNGDNPYTMPPFTNAVYVEVKDIMYNSVAYSTPAGQMPEFTPELCKALLQRAMEFLNAQPTGSVEDELRKARLLISEEEAAG